MAPQSSAGLRLLASVMHFSPILDSVYEFGEKEKPFADCDIGLDV